MNKDNKKTSKVEDLPRIFVPEDPEDLVELKIK